MTVYLIITSSGYKHVLLRLITVSLASIVPYYAFALSCLLVQWRRNQGSKGAAISLPPPKKKKKLSIFLFHYSVRNIGYQQIAETARGMTVTTQTIEVELTFDLLRITLVGCLI